MLSVIIPSREQSFLNQTIKDLLDKAEGEVEVIVVADGYDPNIFWDNYVDKQVILITQEFQGMRAGINAGMKKASGDYVMKIDEHCMVDQGYDTKLAAHCEDNWVVIPRRYRLDAEKWEVIIDGRPPIDYMTLEVKPGYLHGTEDKQRAVERKDWLIDDTMSMQGSCYFMKKSYWESTIGPMDVASYGSFSNEAQEIGLKAWLSGGAVKVNKTTWYAHWHRDKRGYGFTNAQQDQFNQEKLKGRDYCYYYWTTTKNWKYDLNWLVEKFKNAN